MDRTALRELKKGIDLSFKEFSRAYGDGIESFFDPLLYFLIWLEKLLVNSPWPLVIGAFALLAWIGSRSIKLVIGTIVCFIVIGYFGMWKNCMATVAIISVSTLVCIVVGIPIGVLMSKSRRAEKTKAATLSVPRRKPCTRDITSPDFNVFATFLGIRFEFNQVPLELRSSMVQLIKIPSSMTGFNKQ